jgi:oligopeptide transport system substrate-binding protein
MVARLLRPVGLRFSVVCLLSAVACLLLTAACGRRDSPADEGIRTQTLLIGNLAEPQDLDPHIITAYTDMNIVAAIFEGLTIPDERTGLPLPGTSDRWEISPDGLVYKFHIRTTAKWSDGTPVTSRDFAYSFQRILTPELASEYSYMLWPIKNAEAYTSGKLKDFTQVGIATPDDATLVLTLERPTPYLLSLAAHSTWYPVQRACIEKFGTMAQRSTRWTRPGNLVGNGPFKLTEWNPNTRITVEKDDNYWDAASVRLNRIRFFPTESADVEERNFRAGQVHLTYDLPLSKVAAYRAQNPSPLRVDPLLSLYYINFNLQKPPFDNPLVRRALSLAVDREAISHSVLDGVLPAAASFVPPNCGGYNSRSHLAYDVAEAKRLLAAAGYPGGKGLPAFSLQVLNDIRQPKMAEAIQGMWARDLGVHVNIETNEQKIWFQTQQRMQHQIGFMGWTADFPDPVTFLSICQTGNGNNWSGWSNPEFDRLMGEADHTADAAARFELMQRAEAILLAELPTPPLVFRSRTYLMNPAVKNWDPAIIGIHLYKKVYLAP